MALSQSDFVAAYSQMFAAMFRARYQEVGGVLRGKVRELHGLRGDAYKSKLIDKIQMKKHGAFNADIARSNVTVTAPTMSFENYELKTSVDEFEQLDFNADGLRAQAEVHADALTRREDQFLIDAMVSGATKSVAAGGSNMTLEKLKGAYKELVKDGVRGDKMYVLMHVNNFDSLLGETEFASSIFNTAKPLVNPAFGGMVGTYMGFDLIVVGDYGTDQEGNAMGLPVASNIRDCFAFAHNALVAGYRKDPTTRMVPIEQDARTEVLSLLSMGAMVEDARGVVKIECDES